MKQDSSFSRNRHNRSFLATLSAMFSQVQAPSLQISIRSPPADDVVRSLHQQRPQVRVALLGDSQLRLALPRIAAPRPQAYITANIPALLESVLIFDSKYECQSDQRPDSLDLLQECRFRIILPGDLLNFTITVFDPLGQRFHFFQQWFQHLSELRLQRHSLLDSHLVRIPLG